MANPFKRRALNQYQSAFLAGGSMASSTLGNGMEAALGVIPVYSASSLIADHLSAAPLAAYEKSGVVPTKLAEQPELVTNPGIGLDLFSWKHQALSSVLLCGNAYGLILDVDSRGVPSKVAWLNPHEVAVDESGSRPVYSRNGQAIARDSLIHVPGYVLPGSVVGLSPIGLFRHQLSTGVDAQRFGERWFKSNGQPSAILRNSEQILKPGESEAIKEKFKLSVEGGDLLVTGKDWQYQAMAMPAGDAQFLAGIKATANQIAAAFRVAPEDVGGESGGMTLTYKSLEQDQIRFNSRTLRPWAARFEAVLSSYMPEGQYLRFNLDAGARSDLKTRYEAHKIAIDAGFETIDEVRALEERAPLTDKQREKAGDAA